MDKSVPFPTKATLGSAGYDLYASFFNPHAAKGEDPKTVWLDPGDTILIPTGIKLELEEGYEAQIRPRSGLALKYGITVLNSPGTIDSDYRGEIKVLLINHGKKQHLITNGDRIAQLIITKIPDTILSLIEEVNDTERGDGGFGSTGK